MTPIETQNLIAVLTGINSALLFAILLAIITAIIEFRVRK